MHLTVRARRDEADGVVSLILADPDGGDLPVWAPGAHVDLVLDDGVVRQYSLSSDPRDRASWRLGVRREPGGRGGSEYVCTTIDVGDVVEVSGPRNHFALAPAGHYRFVAGGIGITPVLAMIAHAEAVGADWTLLYGGRTRRSMAFLDELAAYGDRVTVVPQDETGLLPLTDALSEVRPDTAIYACGPEPMLAAVEAGVAHWPAGSLHVERFAPRPVGTGDPAGRESPGNPGNPDATFEVEFAVSGVSAIVGPGRSILAVAQEVGVPVDFSCGEGTCGTCETPVLTGRVEHRDSVLDEAEQEEGTCLMICVSRAARGCPTLRLAL